MRAPCSRLLVDDDRLARATWSRLAEPADPRAAELVARLGAGPALERRACTAASDRARAVPRPDWSRSTRGRGWTCCSGWAGGWSVPGDAGVARRARTLLATPPYCLWVRGPLDLGAAPARGRSSIVGSRAATPYGKEMTGDAGRRLRRAGLHRRLRRGVRASTGSAHQAALRAEGPHRRRAGRRRRPAVSARARAADRTRSPQRGCRRQRGATRARRRHAQPVHPAQPDDRHDDVGARWWSRRRSAAARSTRPGRPRTIAVRSASCPGPVTSLGLGRLPPGAAGGVRRCAVTDAGRGRRAGGPDRRRRWRPVRSGAVRPDWDDLDADDPPGPGRAAEVAGAARWTRIAAVAGLGRTAVRAGPGPARAAGAGRAGRRRLAPRRRADHAAERPSGAAVSGRRRRSAAGRLPRAGRRSA